MSIYIGQYDDAGSKNAFYIVPGYRFGKKRIGFKEFGNRGEANFAYKIQSILAEKDLAPKVYGEVGRIQKSGYDGELTGYGYLTEIARPVPDCGDYNCGGNCYDNGCCNSVRFLEVVEMLRHYGLDYNDHHRGNFGYVRRNKKSVLVVIDVGIESFDGWDEDIYGLYMNSDDYGGGSCKCTLCQEGKYSCLNTTLVAEH